MTIFIKLTQPNIGEPFTMAGEPIAPDEFYLNADRIKKFERAANSITTDVVFKGKEDPRKGSIQTSRVTESPEHILDQIEEGIKERKGATTPVLPIITLTNRFDAAVGVPTQIRLNANDIVKFRQIKDYTEVAVDDGTPQNSGIKIKETPEQLIEIVNNLALNRIMPQPCR